MSGDRLSCLVSIQFDSREAILINEYTVCQEIGYPA